MRIRCRAGAARGGRRDRSRCPRLARTCASRVSGRECIHFTTWAAARGRSQNLGRVDRRLMPVTILAVLASCTALLQGPRDTLRLYAVGDINLGRRDAHDRLQQGDTLFPFAAVADTLRAAHILFGNLESAI